MTTDTAAIAGGTFGMGSIDHYRRSSRARHPDDADKPCCIPRNPRGGTEKGSLDRGQAQFPVPRKVIKDGSFLRADSYCMRYRPAARRPHMIDTGMGHVGFRCVVRQPDVPPVGLEPTLGPF